jgi:regulator of sigma E protease
MQFASMDFGSIARMLQVALGIGAVIFVHELGHFIAARLCGVRVEIFSLGFGPRIFGWKRGATVYQLALVPMGGFVKMAGEEAPTGDAPAPDELPAKSVGQRFFIYSGGVLMNVLFALLVFPPILFFGVPFPEPLIGAVSPGGPAWQAGIEPGTRVLAVDGEPIVSFEELHTRIGLSSREAVELRVRAPGAAEDALVRVQPSYEENQGLRTIDVSLAADPEGLISVEAGSPAYEAGLRDGDRLVEADGLGPDAPSRVLFRIRRGEPLELAVVRDGETRRVTVTPRAKAREAKRGERFLSAEAATCRVIGLREQASARALGLRVEDRVLTLDGAPILREGDFALALEAAVGRPFELVVEREQRDVRWDVEALDAAQVAEALRSVALVADVEGTRVAVIPGGPAEQAGLENGDRIVRIGTRPTQRWTDVPLALKAEAQDGAPLPVSVERRAADGTRRYLDFQVLPGALLQPDYGLGLESATYVYRAGSFGEAVQVGFGASVQIMKDIWHFLGGIFRGSVSSDNLGGIIAISRGSYMFAAVGFTKLVFFLCMLSLNLAFLNVLPIPVLDGGHLFFLLVEKLKGSPVNERVLGYSQMVGLVLILGLVVFVTFNDLQRLFRE